VRDFTLEPGELGLPPAQLHALAGGDAQENARHIESILRGEPGPRRDVVLLNAAATLVIAGIAIDFAAGVRCAANAIDSGAGLELLAQLRRFAQKT
jgi:anthranilate phosphoribosyltransferase